MLSIQCGQLCHVGGSTSFWHDDFDNTLWNTDSDDFLETLEYCPVGMTQTLELSVQLGLFPAIL